MRTKKVTRHYCDYCKKSMAFRNHMEKHEKHCTKNPNRECGLCERIGESPRPIAELIAVVPKLENFKREAFLLNDYPDYDAYEKATLEALQELRKLTNNCPACILAALRQSGNTALSDRVFDFKAESLKFLDDTREDCY